MEPKSPVRPTVIQVEPPSPRYTTPAGSPRKVGIPVDLSDESAYAVQWAVQNYLRPGDAVTLIHVRPTSVLYGADWGSTHFTTTTSSSTETTTEEEARAKNKKIEDDFDQLTAEKLAEVAKPLDESKIGYKVHVVKDHDMKERLCLEIERLGMSVVIMGSKGFGASRKRSDNGRLGSVSDYCVHHCVCPVVVVRYPNANENDDAGVGPDSALDTVPEEEVPPVAEVDRLHLHEGDLDGCCFVDS